MHINTIKPAVGAKRLPERVGRGIGSGSGKTCKRGHKGQHSRAGGYHKVGFEGGQMPLQRRMPKSGFRPLKAGCTVEVRLHELEKAAQDGVVSLATLKKKSIVSADAKRVKVIASGTLTKPLHLKGLAVTPGAKRAIESAGGQIEEDR